MRERSGDTHPIVAGISLFRGAGELDALPSPFPDGSVASEPNGMGSSARCLDPIGVSSNLLRYRRL